MDMDDPGLGCVLLADAAAARASVGHCAKQLAEKFRAVDCNSLHTFFYRSKYVDNTYFGVLSIGIFATLGYLDPSVLQKAHTSLLSSGVSAT